jgi:hypothetical protein
MSVQEAEPSSNPAPGHLRAGTSILSRLGYSGGQVGYVDATHQSLRSHIDRTVWTFYWTLSDGSPSQNRQLLLSRDWNYWKEAILHDLERVHFDIRSCVSRIDIMRMGHALARPTAGAVFSPERRHLANSKSRLVFANSDLSAFSTLEEA